MKTNSVEIETGATENGTANNLDLQRFVVFVAGGKHSITSCSNFARAERFALIFAGITNVRMEVFDDVKGICYFVEPSEAKVSLVH
jgi:hypothetical protein